MILKGESEVILCSGKFSGNSCLVGEIYRMVEIKSIFQSVCAATLLFGWGKWGPEKWGELPKVTQLPHDRTEVILKVRTNICLLLMLFLLEIAIFLCSSGGVWIGSFTGTWRPCLGLSYMGSMWQLYQRDRFLVEPWKAILPLPTLSPFFLSI